MIDSLWNEKMLLEHQCSNSRKMLRAPLICQCVPPPDKNVPSPKPSSSRIWIQPLRENGPERRALSQVLHQILDVIEISAQQHLLFLRRPRVPFFAVSACASAGATSPPTLAWTPLQPVHSHHPVRSTCVATASVADRWNWTFGHEVKIQELDQFHLHLAAGGTRFD